MSGDLPELRASDADRERVVAQLRDGSVQGRLTLEEFSDRLAKAYSARTGADLDELVRDLPAEVSPTTALSRRRRRRFTVAAFGSVQRTGRWRMPGSGFVGVAFGDADIDLRKAELDGPVVSLTAFVLFGNVDVYVPEGVDVDLSGIAVFGHRREFGSELPVPSGAPLLRVRIVSLFGTGDVWRVPHAWAARSFRQVIKGLRKGEHVKELGR
jgi:Domain of unknown function (DUF1707)/Cell wall-active antibiotics response 4TMS YvqF